MSNIVDRLTPKQKNSVDFIYQECIKAGITNLDFIASLIALCNKESGLIPQSEIMNYSKERLPEVWGVFSKTGSKVKKGQGKYNYNDLAVKYANNPEGLANYVYGIKPYGMRTNAGGNTAPGDGHKYRGRGFNGITFKGLYKILSDKYGIDYVNNPDLINEPEHASKALIYYFTDLNKEFKPNEVTNVLDANRKTFRLNNGWGNGWPTSNSQGFTQMNSEAPQYREYLEKLSKQPINNKKTNIPKFLFLGLLILGGYIVYKNLNKQPNVENLPLTM